MAEIITESGRKAIKKMAEISQCARALSLMPTAEDFALRIIGDLRIIGGMVNNISTRIDEILTRYASIPVEFLYEGFDLILEKLHNLEDFAKFAIEETMDVMSSTVGSAKELNDALGSAMSATTSAVLQIGGGLSYGAVAMGANIELAVTGNGRRSMTNDVVQDVVDGKVAVGDMEEEFENRIDNQVGKLDDTADAIRDWTVNAATNSTEAINDAFGKSSGGLQNALDWVDNAKSTADSAVDNTIGVLIEKVENAKREVEEQVERVKEIFNNLTKNFDEAFGFVNGKNFAEETFRNISNTAYESMDGPVFDAIGEMTGEVADFIKNFNVGKVVTSLGGIVVGAGAATLAMDLLPNIDVEKMLRRIIGGVDRQTLNKKEQLQQSKYNDDGIELLDIPDVPWRLSKDDLETYNAEAYNKYLEEFSEENDKERAEILEQMQKAQTPAEIRKISRENKEKMKENKSALKAMRKIRRDAIKARQIEKYKGFLKIELDYLKREVQGMKDNVKNEWDAMMSQYKGAVAEIKKFFTEGGYGGNESIDRCCDRINDDATQIVELCQSITVELTNAVAMVPTPYAIGPCVDMPVHKLLAFFKDVKIIITFLKNLIRLGVDIVSQMSILAKIVCNGMQSISEIIKLIMDILGIDKILKMIDFLVALFRPKMIDAKILLENAISPIYYNETEEYEERVEALEKLLEDDKNGGDVVMFKYTDDPYARKKYKNKEINGGGKDDEEIEELLEELEAKGEREIVAYRSPILNDAGDDFAGWIYYHAYAYDKMKKDWSDAKKRRRNKLIKKASKKNKMVVGKLVGGVALLKQKLRYGYYDGGKYIGNSVNGFDAYYWYTKWTNDPTDCDPDFSNGYTYNEDGSLVLSNPVNTNVVAPIQTTSNGSLVELSDGRRVFVEGKIVKSGDYVNVNGVKYRVK